MSYHLPFHLETGERTQKLIERISELEEENSNLRRLESDIRLTTQFYRSLLASSQDGITLTRLDGTVVRVVRSILGYGETGLSGVSVYTLIHPEDQPALRECYRQLAEGAGQVSITMRMFRAGGPSEWMHFTMTDMLEDPAVQTIVFNYRVVTVRRKGELAMAELSAVVERAPFSIFTRSATGEILTWNEGARRMFGYGRDEIVGEHISTLIPPGRRDEEQQLRQAVVTQGVATPEIDTVHVAKDGRLVPIELVLSPVFLDTRIGGVAQLSYPARGTQMLQSS